jgi:PIN domain nuclease of toxin-antitoxin system
LKVVLDTHIWLTWLLEPSRLSTRERQTLNVLAEGRDLALPAICLWEAQVLHSKGRIKVPLAFASWIRRATAPDVITLLPLDVNTVVAIDDLPDWFHGDPADRIIVATARVNDLPLATHDAEIETSRLVKIWTP